ncbi:G protein-regulated inducer of neurite outgrowth 3 [Frankliniella fusca]|uniref:G protein-regulated inducer of neurite outgrowth 3 n=1 Tax=Frankliniella fusca TaxID=407009 RepID=A0AAE1HPQ1_9NEOP|nr:G protein-regulated inducer of neurite outgrowth 3 [Frankliniella fusca]KAK3925241.1 G protein-regulated inducer of neurite outgrowth 3 [Frankliniella fusca]
MEQYFFCLVNFGDNKLVVRSTEVRDFNPEHANDFEQDRKYDVLWQEQSGSFDGYFPAIIMCMAASLPELKQKARSVGVSRLPRSYELLLKAENHDSDGVISSDTSETKSKKNREWPL